MDAHVGRTATVAVAIGSLALLAAGQVVSGQSPAAATMDLDLRVAGIEGGPAARLATAFAARVDELTQGAITVAPATSRDGGAPADQAAAVSALLAGDTDLVLTDSRAWDAAGVGSLRALDLPGLITDDALASLVASSPVARHALGGLATQDVTGIALWPTGLRHAVALGGHPALVDASAFQGARLALLPTPTTNALATALGATISDVTGPVEGWGAAADGAEWGYADAGSPPAGAIAASDVVLSPGFMVLAIRTSVADALGQSAVQALMTAAADAPYAPTAPVLDERAMAAAWCAQGGQVASTSPDGLASLAIALQPVIDAQLDDPLTASLVDQIVGYRDAVPATPTVEGCDPTS